MSSNAGPKPCTILIFTVVLLLALSMSPSYWSPESPVGLAQGVQSQRDATACEAFGNNWTNCDDAFASDDIYAEAEGVLGATQFPRPDADVSNAGGWAPTPLWQQLDETSSDGDTTYIGRVSSSSSSDGAEVGLSDLTDPVSSAGHIIRFSARKTSSRSGDVSFDLYQGTTLIATTASLSLSTSYQTQIYTLTSGETDSITDYNDLRYRVDFVDIAGGVPGEVRVTWAELEVPGPIVAGKNDTVWLNFGYSLNPTDTIGKVEVGVEWFRTTSEPVLNVTVSWDGGTSWASNQTATNKSSDDNTLEFLDFTSATGWDNGKLSDSNFRLRIGTNASGARLDYLTVRVTFSTAPPSLSNFRLQAGSSQSQRAATACEAVGNNWTNCQDAFSSDNAYAYANDTPRGPTQFARPDSTISTGGFTAVGAPTHHEATDEVTANGDTDYDEADSADTTLELGLSDVTDPELSTGHIMRFTHNSSGTNPPEKLNWQLMQEGTQIVVINNVQISRGSYATASYTLSSAEADTITDYSDLRFRFTLSGLEAGEFIRITQAEFEVPGTPPGPGYNDTVWKDFGFTFSEADSIAQVEIGVEWFRNNIAPILNVTVSWDGGSTWATNQTAANKTADDDTVEFLDFTSATSWNASKLNDANLRVRAGTNASGARLDYVTVRVNYNASQAGQQLDVDVEYYFFFNVTDDDGWTDIGDDGSVSLRLWYDGNASPELTFGEQTTGANYRIVLTYQDTSDPSTASLSEWSVTEGRATYNASASTLTSILSGPTVIGYEFKLCLKLGFQVKHAMDPTNGATGSYNDRDSWNAELSANDGIESTTLQTASTGEHMEFGVFMYTFVNISADWSVALDPGASGDTNTVTVYYRSNDDFRMTVWFTTHLVKGGDTIDISNVQILAAADPNDNITSDATFGGLDEANAVYIFGSATWWFSHSVDGDENTVVVQFRVSVPSGTPWGTYVAQLTIKVVQRPA